MTGESGEASGGTLFDRIVGHLGRRRWPLVVSTLFVTLGTAYFFRWGPVVRHDPSFWVSPGDLWTTYAASIAFAHGHFGAVYSSGMLALPGFLVLLAPLGAAANSLHPHALIFLGPYTLVVACVILFACDAMAERLGVTVRRRALLSVVEGVLLWNVVVLWGHPEDAVAVALALYAVLSAFDGRWAKVGWLLGAAFAVQALVVVVFPLLLFLGGRRRVPGLVVRGVVPAAVVTLPPLVANVHRTVHAIVTQPMLPFFNHQTPWTFLAPKLGGVGPAAMVGSGPMRVVALALAVGLGWWACRWREKPEMIVWTVAVALALRCYTESVMTSYYVWPALAVGVVIAARRNAWCFGLAVVAAVMTTVTAQWNVGEYSWWTTDVVGLTVVLAAAAGPTSSATRRWRGLVSAPRSA